MNSIYALVIIFYQHGRLHGTAVRFPTQAQCLQAIKQAEKDFAPVKIKAACVQVETDEEPPAIPEVPGERRKDAGAEKHKDNS